MNDFQPLPVRALNAAELAQKFGVSATVMERFLNRFAPSLVQRDTFKSPADILLFVHIPKTAGVSLGESCRAAFDEFHGVRWNNVAASFRHATRLAIYRQSQGDKRQVIMGHYGWSELQIWRNHQLPMKCATVLRDPVARVISHYNYSCSEAHPDAAGFKARFPTLESFIKNLTPDEQITQAIGMIDSFETALNKLLNYYTFLGTTEAIGPSLAHLGRSHGLARLREHRKNVALIPAPAHIPNELRQHIEAMSFNDIKLHRLLTYIYGH